LEFLIFFISKNIILYKNINGTVIFDTDSNISFGDEKLEKYKTKAGFLSY